MGWEIAVIVAIGTILGGGGLAAVLRIKPEKNQILVQSAERVVVLQSSELNRLAERLERLESKVVKYEKQVEELSSRLDQTEEQLEDTRRERDTLKRRVQELERKEKRTHG